MSDDGPIDVIIPAFNEEAAIGKVLADLPGALVRHIIVVDNNSTDRTARVAAGAGATVVTALRRGYGSACLAGIASLARLEHAPHIVVFLDADYSDHPDELPRLVEPLRRNEADLVVGSRVLGRREPGALMPQARFGNWLSTRLIRALYGVRMTDLGPFRAILWNRLVGLEMSDPDFGWTVEMQVKVAREGLVYREVPVSYRRRIGTSKISGTVSGSLRAGWKILYTIFRLAR
ncbi:MAG: glycosyltransferase [Acidobacteria bacterium]|nr:MAG: glycosyltransferase [Acidobacteriota bacterium]